MTTFKIELDVASDEDYDYDTNELSLAAHKERVMASASPFNVKATFLTEFPDGTVYQWPVWRFEGEPDDLMRFLQVWYLANEDADLEDYDIGPSEWEEVK